MSVGVVIARFQVAGLTPGHQALLRHVHARHEVTVVLLGCSPAQFTKRNPLPYWMRQRMVKEFDPLIDVYPLLDSPSDVVWSDSVDKLLTTIYPGQPITLYGGRDSFQPHYKGKLAVRHFDEVTEPSGTSARAEMVDALAVSTERTREGVIFAVESAFTRVNGTVDIAILDDTREKVLVARKLVEELPHGYRFIGGFVDPTDITLEDAARREVAEETGLEIDNLRYVGSHQVPDWRYRGGPESIMTTFFVADKLFGHEEASDDITELVWLDIDQVWDQILPVHSPLAVSLMTFLGKCSTTSPKSST